MDEDVQKNKEVVQEDNRRFELVDKQRGLLEERLSEDNSDSFNLALKDNQGRTLTKEQEKYFKNSKVLDRDGKLKVLYHGTPYKFNTFNYSKLGENTSSLGAGFYFSDNQRTGQEYARGNGNVKEVYVDIKKPLSYGKTTMSKSEYKKFIEKVNEETKGAYLVDYDGIDNALMEYDYGGDDIDLVNAVHNASGLSWEKTYEILRKTTGFDGIISEEGFVNEGETIYVAFNANQIKNINNTNPTENPDIRFSKENTTWQEYLDKNYKATGTRTNLQNIKLPTAPRQQISSGEIAGTSIKNRRLNPIQISKLTEEDANTTPKLQQRNYRKGNKQSNFFSNIVTDSQFLDKELRQEMSNEDNIKYYKGITNSETLEKAYNSLKKGGAKETLNWFNKENKNTSAEDVTKGWILLKQYQDAGDYQSAVEVAKKMRTMATSAGQAVQAYNIMSRLTPEGMFYYAQSELNEAYNKMVEGKSKEWIDKNASEFNLTPKETQTIIDTMKEISNLEDGRMKNIKLAEIQKLISNKIPPTAGQSIKTWMRISMLFNPKTQVRNIAGNATILPVNATGDMFAAGLDKLISKKTGVRTTGTTSIKN